MAHLSIYGQYVLPLATNGHIINKVDTTNFDTEEDGTYFFKVEEQAAIEYVSVGQVAVRYKCIGMGTLTVTLVGPTDSQTQTLILGDPTKTKGYYGGGTVPKFTGDGKSYVAIYCFHPLTDESFQVQLSRLANSGPLAIEKVSVFGEMKEIPR